MELCGIVLQFISKWEIVEIVELNCFTKELIYNLQVYTVTDIGRLTDVSHLADTNWSGYVCRRTRPYLDLPGRILAVSGHISGMCPYRVPARAAAAATVARALAGLPPHQRLALSASSSGLTSVYGSGPRGQTVERLEEEFYEEDFDPVRHTLKIIPIEENDLIYFEKKVSQRLVQLDVVTEQLSHKVMEHHEELVKGMQVVTEVEQDLQVANVICKNGRRHLSSSMNEVSRDLIVTSNAKRKQFFLAWLARTLEKLDALLLGVCQKFNPESYIMVVDAYALIDDISGFADKLQNVFTQIVLMETQTVLKDFVFQGLDSRDIEKKSRLTYNDLCFQLPETKFRHCLLKTLEVLFEVMCSYHSMMTWKFLEKALRMVLEKEIWQQISPETIKTVNLAGLVGDGAPLLVSYHLGSSKELDLDSDHHSVVEERKELHTGFGQWRKRGNPFGYKKCPTVRDGDRNLHEVSAQSVSNLHDKQRAGSLSNGTIVTEVPEKLHSQNGVNIERGEEDESEDLLADFIDEDSQLPSRVSNVALARTSSSRNWIQEEIEGLTGSSLTLLRSMDKYARLMQKLETISIEFFKGICQLFELYFYIIFKTFGQRDGSGSNRGSMESLNPRLRLTLGKIAQDLQEQRIKMHGGSVVPVSSNFLNNSFFQLDAALPSPIYTSNVLAPSNLYGLK
ncbi:hypothetical protein KI387_006357, partial [Taxus chinensis]